MTGSTIVWRMIHASWIASLWPEPACGRGEESCSRTLRRTQESSKAPRVAGRNGEPNVHRHAAVDDDLGQVQRIRLRASPAPPPRPIGERDQSRMRSLVTPDTVLTRGKLDLTPFS